MARANDSDDEDVEALLARCRSLCADSAWADARELLSSVDRRAALGFEDLELLARAAGLSGDHETMIRAHERLHHGYLQGGQPRAAARAAFWIAYRLIPLGEMARAQAWLARAQRVVDEIGEECAERGLLLLPGVHRHLQAREWERAEEEARSACELGLRFGDGDLTILAKILWGRSTAMQGRVVRGLELLDDAMLAVNAQELSPHVIGIAYCHVISAYTQLFALDRAREWTAALGRWCDVQPQLTPFAGLCSVHRAELMALGGDWSDALEEIKNIASSLPLSENPKAHADAVYQEAEIHRLRGEVDAAEQAYARASQCGRDPYPGLALLRLLQKRGDVAAASMRRIMVSTQGKLERARYLPAHLEIMLAAGELAEASAAAAELEETARAFDTDALRAMSVHARGAVELGKGQAQAAIEPLRAAFDAWQRIGAPYLAARVRVLLAGAYRVLGDDDAAELESCAAREVFGALGAEPDLAAIAHADKGASGRPAHRESDGKLSNRELEVLRLVAAGKTNRSIATELFLSEKTIDRHVSNIFLKLAVSSRAAATAYAYQHGLI